MHATSCSLAICYIRNKCRDGCACCETSRLETHLWATTTRPAEPSNSHVLPVPVQMPWKWLQGEAIVGEHTRIRLFSRNMQHYRTAESLLPAIPVPGMQRGRLLCCQPLILTLVSSQSRSYLICSMQVAGVDMIKMLLETPASLESSYRHAPAATLQQSTISSSRRKGNLAASGVFDNNTLRIRQTGGA